MNPLAIVLPCYNPPHNWEQTVVNTYDTIRDQLGFEPQLIIVNDGSNLNLDEAIQYIQSKITSFHFINNPTNKGKGSALRLGFKECQALHYIYTDIDFPYTTASLISIYQKLIEGNDVVAGIKDDTYYQHTPFIRKVISQTLRFMVRHLLQMDITDTQCGLKGFNEKGKSIFMQTTIHRYLFDLELIYFSTRKNNNIKVIALPVKLRSGIIFRKMNPTILIDESLNFFKMLWRSRFHSSK